MTTNLTRFLTRSAGSTPRKVAVVGPSGVELTFSELNALVNTACSYLVEHKVRRADVLAHLFRDETLALICMLATARIGATVFSIPIHAPLKQREAMASSVCAASVVTDLQPPIPLGALTCLPLSKELLESATDPADAEQHDNDPVAPWLINTGSGTTGRPKLIEVSHTTFVSRMQLYSSRIHVCDDDRVSSLLSIDFPSAKNQLLNALYEGATIHFFDRVNFDPIPFCRERNLSILYVASPHLHLLVRSANIHKQCMASSLRAVVPSGSTIGDTIRHEFRRTFGDILYVRYGTAETGPVTDATPSEVAGLPGTIGNPIGDTRVEIVDDGDHRVDRGVTGKIRIRSSGMIHGYRHDPPASRQAFRNGWFYPGDLGRIHTDGQLVFCGREDDLLNMDGIKVFPIEIENTLMNHPAVKDVAVVPLKHPIHQDIPLCAVTLNADSRVGPMELYRFAKERLGVRSPRKVVVLDSIPRTGQAKLIKKQLLKLINNPTR